MANKKHTTKRALRGAHVLPALLALSAVAVIGGAHPLGVLADEMLAEVPVYDKQQGELSPGTGAPSTERMVNAIRSASPTALYAMLEYGERVECYECMPLLEAKLLDSDDAQVREISAWWLRRRPFGYGRAAVAMRNVVIEDADPVRRARAAEALGEFLDPKGLPALQEAAMVDDTAEVRGAAVRALGRLNVRAGTSVISAAFLDEDASVRYDALSQVTRVNFFEDHAGVVERLSDDDAMVRTRAAQLVGELKIPVAQMDRVDDVAQLLEDDSPATRQAAAWALGRVGGSDAVQALRDAEDAERDPQVSDAIEVALKMAVR